MSRLQIRRFRLTIGQVMVAIAVCAVACAWPERFVFATSMILGAFLNLGAIFSKVGRRVFEWCVVVAIIGMLLALSRPSVVMKCRLLLTKPALQQVWPAATVSGENGGLR
jgi:hypothetical protein